MMDRCIIKDNRKFPTMNFLSLSLIMLTVLGGAGTDFDIACGDDTVFGFLAGGNTIIENVLGATWGVGTSVTANFYPLATEFASHAMDFANLIVDPAAGGSCNEKFSTWMSETFATKEETLTWIEQKADYIEKETFNLIESIQVGKVLESMHLLANAEIHYTNWITGGRVEGTLDNEYQERLDDAQSEMFTCATAFLEAAGRRGSFESAKVAALAAGARCAVYFYAVLHLEYATAKNKNRANQQVFINDLNYYKNKIAEWEDDFNSAVEAIKERRNDKSLMEYTSYKGSCEKEERWYRGCSDDKRYHWNEGSTQCVFTDRAFDPSGKTTIAKDADWAYLKTCDKKKDLCNDIVQIGCVDKPDSKRRAISDKYWKLVEKLDQFHQRIFMIDFTKATDVISQMISGVEHGLLNDLDAHSTCSLKKDSHCTGSRYEDKGFMDSASCMAECKANGWCNCITMSKNFGCRLESGSVTSSPYGHWALNKADCEECELQQGRTCSGTNWTNKQGITDPMQCMAECKKHDWCNCITMGSWFDCRLEEGVVYGHGSQYSAMNRASCGSRRRLTDVESAPNASFTPPERSEERGDIKMY